MKQGITTLFLDIGGVLLTNGWGHESRHLAAGHFHLDADEMNERHHLTFDTYEEGKITLDEYLSRVIFVVYIEDRRLFVEVASELGLNTILHMTKESTQKQLENFGLVIDRS
ncbi:MAG: hypothetical protein GX491_01420 [Chloroflexi bacterium]|nr:hypothetical protein [Chloroflexota bacterium]